MIPGCLVCKVPALKYDGCTSMGGHRFRCRRCGRTRTDRSGTPFARYRWPREVIVTAVRWYGRFRLSLRDVCDLLAEHGVDVSPRTVLSWVHTFGPLLAAELRRKARPLGRRWYVDETYVRVGGRWAYLYRAVDETGQVVDILLRAHRDLVSARAFLQQARRRRTARPTTVITDKHPAYDRAIRRHVPRAIHVRTGLHQLQGETTKRVERSHAPVKDRLRAMRGLRSVATGQRVVESVEAAQAVHRGDLCGTPRSAAIGSTAGAGARARAAALTFLFTARDLRVPGYPPAVCWGT
jgi:transposase-like protein